MQERQDYFKEYYEKNREHIANKKREWYLRNKERISQKRKLAYQLKKKGLDNDAYTSA